MSFGDAPQGISVAPKYDGNKNFKKVSAILEEEGLELPMLDEEHADAYSIVHNLKYDLICGLYLESPEDAIDSLRNYIKDIYSLPKYSASLKLTYVNRLISWYLERNEFTNAQGTVLLGINVVQTILKEDGLGPLGEFAEYCYLLHDYKNARRFMNIYMRYMNRYYSDDDLEYLLAEARFVKYMGNTMSLDDKVDKLSHCCERLRTQIENNFAGMTSTQQEYFANKLDEPFSFALQLLGDFCNNSELSKLCFENEVFKRGLLLRSDILLRQALTETKDSSLVSDYNQFLSFKRELIARNEIVGPGNFARRMYLETQINNLEKRLSSGCAEFSRANKVSFCYTDLKSSLDKGESLVTYVEVPSNQGVSLSAFVLNREKGLNYIKLCSPTQIRSIENKDVLNLCVDSNSYKYLFAQIEEYIGERCPVIYSPAGVVNRIPLSALFINDNTILSDRHRLTVYANPVDLLFRDSNSNFEINRMTASIWGGIDYGKSTKGVDSLNVVRASMRGFSLTELPGSKDEVKYFENILQGTAQVKKYTGIDATEYSFKEFAPQANIIHVSTHGFFNEDDSHEQSSAMHNAGLFFANSNPAWNDNYVPQDFKKDYEDGILRAEEIETQNLSSCKLVVLSACETGLGKVNGDEGVYGLQRAFKLAGVKHILMSLWSVPDAPTAELMRRFYTYLVSTKDVDEAFLKAQESMRYDTNHIYGPKDWGGFIILH